MLDMFRESNLSLFCYPSSWFKATSFLRQNDYRSVGKT